jgi:hypothetical protein
MLEKKYNVIVVGGGPGGFSAAIACAKRGVSTLLVEKYGFLGGMATAGLVNPFMGYKLKGKNLTSGVFNELIDRLERERALDEKQVIFDDEKMKIVLDNFIKDYKVDVLFHSLFTDVEVHKGIIKAIHINGKSGKIILKGDVFIDSTGDGDLGALAGAKIEFGRKEDGLCQPMTLCFRVGGISGNLPAGELGKELTEILLEAKKRKEVNQPRENVLVFSTLIPHIYHFNTTRVIKKSGIDVFQLTEAEFEGRRQVYELFNLFKKYSPRFKDAYIVKIACQIGVRETRRIIGKYVITEEDVISGRKFEDGIARSNYPIDVHSPTGSGTVIKGVKEGDFYEIPFRCLIPEGLKNLFIGSRCISSTHEAHASLRVMPVVSGIGEASGIGAAIAIKKGILPIDIDGCEVKKEIFN